MSEIDVSKCRFYNNGCDSHILCTGDDDIYGECYYKQLQQLKAKNEGLQSLNDFNMQKIETLEVENEELKNKLKTIYDILDMCEGCNCTDCKYEDYDNCTSLNHNDILKLIKQAKEGE